MSDPARPTPRRAPRALTAPSALAALAALAACAPPAARPAYSAALQPAASPAEQGTVRAPYRPALPPTPNEVRRRATVTRIEELLVGRFAGVHVTTYGDALSVRVRAAAGMAEPLVVLDGVPVMDGARTLALLPPSDVERIEVLKDVASTSRYGTRGANGVLVVTTRRLR